MENKSDENNDNNKKNKHLKSNMKIQHETQ